MPLTLGFGPDSAWIQVWSTFDGGSNPLDMPTPLGKLLGKLNRRQVEKMMELLEAAARRHELEVRLLEAYSKDRFG